MRESPRQSRVRIAVAVGAVLGVALSLPAPAAGETPQLIRFHGGAYDSAGAITANWARDRRARQCVEKEHRPRTLLLCATDEKSSLAWTHHL